MKKTMFERRVVAGLLVSGLLSSASIGVRTAAAASDPRADMVTALQAMAPHASLGDQAKIFDRFVGTWDVEYTDFSKSGKVTHRTGQMIFGWIMDGRAMQDLWIVDPSGGRTEREVYADVSYFDPKSQKWLSISIDPEHAAVAKLVGGAVGEDRIVLDTPDLGYPDDQWSFNEIRPNSFVWRDQSSSDGGKTWKLHSEYHMTRRGSAAPS